MGGARAASQSPDPRFKDELEKLTKMPESRERSEGVASLMFFGPSGSNSVMGRASGGGIPKAVSGIVRPSASATIKAPEPPAREESDGTQDTEQNFDDVRTNLLAKAKERRSKLSEMKQEVASKLAIPTPTSELDKFSIDNYRAGGAAFDRDDTKSVGDDMSTGRPSTSERTKSFLSGMTGNSPLQFMVRGG